MALKVFEGFDHYNAAADFLARTGFLQWQFPSAAPGITFPAGLTDYGKSVRWGQDNNIGAQNLTVRAVFQDRNAEAFVGQRIKIGVGGADDFQITLVDTVSGLGQCYIFFNHNNYTIGLFSGTGTLLALSPNNSWTGNTNQFIEIHFKIATSGGILEVRQDNQVVVTYTGNTQRSTNAWCDALDYHPSTGTFGMSGFITLDDLYYCDTTTGPGTTPANSYLSDVAVRPLFAIGNDSVSWTPLTGTNWEMIDETAMDGDTTYNSTSTVNNEDRFNFQSLTGGVDLVYGLQVVGAYRKTDGGAHTIKQSVKSGSTEDYGPDHQVNTSYFYTIDLWILNPDTGLNWTLAEINAMKAAYKLTS